MKPHWVKTVPMKPSPRLVSCFETRAEGFNEGFESVQLLHVLLLWSQQLDLKDKKVQLSTHPQERTVSRSVHHGWWGCIADVDALSCRSTHELHRKFCFHGQWRECDSLLLQTNSEDLTCLYTEVRLSCDKCFTDAAVGEQQWDAASGHRAMSCYIQWQSLGGNTEASPKQKQLSELSSHAFIPCFQLWSEVRTMLDIFLQTSTNYKPPWNKLLACKWI